MAGSATAKGKTPVARPTTKAVAIDRFGPPQVLKLHKLPVPQPGPEEVLIAVKAAGVGVWDASGRDGSWRSYGRPKFPLVLGTDDAGVIVGKRGLVRRFRVGDRVYAVDYSGRFYAEFVATDANNAAHVPRRL
jgi:NADPH:quinone reductase